MPVIQKKQSDEVKAAKLRVEKIKSNMPHWMRRNYTTMLMEKYPELPYNKIKSTVDPHSTTFNDSIIDKLDSLVEHINANF